MYGDSMLSIERVEDVKGTYGVLAYNYKSIYYSRAITSASRDRELKLYRTQPALYTHETLFHWLTSTIWQILFSSHACTYDGQI